MMIDLLIKESQRLGACLVYPDGSTLRVRDLGNGQARIEYDAGRSIVVRTAQAIARLRALPTGSDRSTAWNTLRSCEVR